MMRHTVADTFFSLIKFRRKICKKFNGFCTMVTTYYHCHTRPSRFINNTILWYNYYYYFFSGAYKTTKNSYLLL
jgi:hypothetical protein